MGKIREVKRCAHLDTCDRTLPLNSKHILCPRCRAHDKRTSGRDPGWLKEHIVSCARWTNAYTEHLPKKDRANFTIEYTLESPPRNNVTPLRKRA